MFRVLNSHKTQLLVTHKAEIIENENGKQKMSKKKIVI